jgi:hypothetical protein
MPLPAAALSELEQAAGRNGYPADPVENGDWLLLRSPWTRHELLATSDGSAFVVATRSSGVATEAAREFATWSGVLPPSAVLAFSVVDSAALHALIDRLYRLGLSLPPEPLLDFEEQVAGLPRETEAERLVVVRIRVVDDALNERDTHQSADGSGHLNARLPIPCNSGLGLHFSATDGRPDSSDLTGFLWSNTFNIPCP